MTIREKNKCEGKLCGNCVFGEECDRKNVYCRNPHIHKAGQNEMNWRRKNKGGCIYWNGTANLQPKC